MGRNSYTAEEIIAKLRQVDVMVSQIKAHWRYDYDRCAWEWVLGHWSNEGP